MRETINKKTTMKYILHLTILMFVTQVLRAQKNKTLSEKLWKQVEKCHSMLEDTNKDGKIDYTEIIDDSKNGYLKISGTFPPCGCTCKNTVGAYKTNANKYVFVKKYFWACSWHEGISSNKYLTELFPFDFEVDGFFQKKIDNPNKIATFYLDIEIPRIGTDTKVMIKLIPLGLKMEGKKNIEFGYNEENRFFYGGKLREIRRMVSEIKNYQTIENLLNNNFSSIIKQDSIVVDKAIGKNYDKFKNKEDLVKLMRKMKQIYDLYTQIKYESLILGWNRSNGTFYIKKKVKRTKTDSFVEFLKNTKIYGTMC